MIDVPAGGVGSHPMAGSIEATISGGRTTYLDRSDHLGPVHGLQIATTEVDPNHWLTQADSQTQFPSNPR